MGVEFDPADLVAPVNVDFTPSVAVSSFVFYEGDAFPAWRGHMLVGSLKGSDVYRFAMQDGEVAERETVLEDLARIRDIEVGPDGRIFLLLEHDGSLAHGPDLRDGALVRMDPSPSPCYRQAFLDGYDPDRPYPTVAGRLGPRQAFLCTASGAHRCRANPPARTPAKYVPD